MSTKKNEPSIERKIQYLFTKVAAMQQIQAALIDSHPDHKALINALTLRRDLAAEQQLFKSTDEVIALHRKLMDEMVDVAQDALNAQEQGLQPFRPIPPNQQKR